MTVKVGDIVIYKVGENDSDIIKNNHADELPAIVVCFWDADCVNLKVFCDGPQDAWVTSALKGTEPSNWRPVSNELS